MTCKASLFQISCMDEALVLIDDLRTKFSAQGQQIITYRRKLRQQESVCLSLSSYLRDQSQPSGTQEADLTKEGHIII